MKRVAQLRYKFQSVEWGGLEAVGSVRIMCSIIGAGTRAVDDVYRTN